MKNISIATEAIYHFINKNLKRIPPTHIHARYQPKTQTKMTNRSQDKFIKNLKKKNRGAQVFLETIFFFFFFDKRCNTLHINLKKSKIFLFFNIFNSLLI